MYYKVGQALLQSRACITRWDKFYYKLRQVSQIETTSITKWGNYYEVGQYKGQCDLRVSTDLFRKINILVRVHTLYVILAS